MRPLLLLHDKAHFGLCTHHAETDPDSIVLCESAMFTDDPDHQGVWIGRFAEAPWEAMANHMETTGVLFTWHVVKIATRN